MASGLFEAITRGRYRHMRFLLDSGLSVNSVNSRGETCLVAVLHLADDTRRRALLTFLLRRGADALHVDPVSGRDALLWACYRDLAAEATLLLRTLGADACLSRRDRAGCCALHYTALNGNVALTRQLCAAMARYEVSVDIDDDRGFTPYLVARRLGHDHCATALAHVGGASQYQFDSRRFRTTAYWAEVGRRERRARARQWRLRRSVAQKVIGTCLSQLEARGGRRRDTAIAASILATAPADHRQLTGDRPGAGGLKRPPWQAAGNEKTLRFRVPRTRPAQRAQCGCERHARHVKNFEKQSCSERADKSAPGDQDANEEVDHPLGHLMRLLTQQCSQSYRPYARLREAAGVRQVQVAATSARESLPKRRQHLLPAIV